MPPDADESVVQIQGECFNRVFAATVESIDLILVGWAFIYPTHKITFIYCAFYKMNM